MQLKQYVDQIQMPLADLAAALGVSYEAVRRYYTGDRKPSWRVMAKLKLLTKGQVTADDFLPPVDAPERRRLVDAAE